jgi:hypothetical protein
MQNWNQQYGARADAKDPYGLFVIDTSNNPSGKPNGYGWAPAPGSGPNVRISSDFFGKNPDNRAGHRGQ